MTSAWLTVGVATGWLGGVLALHRLNVRRVRARALGFATLRRFDWDLLLAGLLQRPLEPGEGPRPPEGGAGPRVLAGAALPEAQTRAALLSALVAGAPVEDAAWERAGFAGAELPWLGILSRVRAEPRVALERLEQTRPTSAAEIYLREHLRLSHQVGAVNLEFAAFGAKLRLGKAMDRFEGTAGLHFARAQASALLGFRDAVLDDLARAVYHSRQAPFYLRVVVDMPWVEEARPPLWHQCRLALAPDSNLSSNPPRP